MKRIYFLKRFVAFLLIATGVMAQRVEMIDGNFDALKVIKKLNVKYDYSKIDVGKKSEQDYTAEKKEAFNDKEPGKRDKWAKDWVADRDARFEPRQSIFASNKMICS